MGGDQGVERLGWCTGVGDGGPGAVAEALDDAVEERDQQLLLVAKWR